MRKIVLAGALALAASTAQAVTIDFEGLGDGSVVGTIGNATFSGPDGVRIWNFGGDYAQSGVNTIGGFSSFNSSILVSFGTAVSGLSFWSGGDDNYGLQAMIDVFVGGVFSTTVSLLGDGSYTTTDFQDLSAFSNVTSIFIHDVTDAAGLVYDDFTYQTAAVPVPAAGLMLLSALGGLGLAKRRRRAS